MTAETLTYKEGVGMATRNVWLCILATQLVNCAGRSAPANHAPEPAHTDARSAPPEHPSDGQIEQTASKTSSEPEARARPPEPEVPLLPFAHQPLDPAQVKALRDELEKTATLVAPKARPVGEALVSTLAPGQSVQRSDRLTRDACYTAIAIAKAGGVTRLELELVKPDTDEHIGPKEATGSGPAVIGTPPNCISASPNQELRIVLTAIEGSGLIAARLYAR